MTDKGWYYEELGESVGPISAVELKSLADSGTITPFTNVKQGINGSWVPAGSEIKTPVPRVIGQSVVSESK